MESEVRERPLVGPSIKKEGKAKLLKSLLQSREFVLAVALLMIIIVMKFVSPFFLTLTNIRGLLVGTTMIGIISVGMTGVLVTGGLDLSVGSTLALAGIIAGISLRAGIPVTFSVIFALLSAGAVGFLNGLFISKLKFDPFITTLASMIIVRGLLLVISNGHAIINLPDSFNQIGQGTFQGFQYPVYYFFIIAIVGDFLFRKSYLFRLSYYVGSNQEAATMCGINVERIKILNYVIVAIFAGIAGICMTARMGMASVTIGESTPLPVLAACVIGGASFRGGEGTVLGAVLGAFLLELLINALNIAGIGIYWQQVFTGAILLSAIALDKFKKK